MRAAVIPVTPLQQNCTLFWCTKSSRAVVIDPGGDLPKIEAALKKNAVELEKILVTHGHLDHAGAVRPLAEEYEVPIEGPHREDQFWISRIEEDARNYGLSAQSFTPTRWLEQGDQVMFGDNIRLEVFHCPGHTPGHIIFYHQDSKLAQVGDVLFQGSIGRTDFPRGDHTQLLQSITKNLWPLGNDVTFIPGHGPVSTFGQERRSNPFVADAVLARQNPF